MSPEKFERWFRGARIAATAAALALAASAPDPAGAQVLLEGGSEGVILSGNDFQCGVTANANTCADLGDSPTSPGGFWPTGSPNAYMFNSGLMVAGIVGGDVNFDWAGDTVGAYFFNASGGTHAAAIVNIWNSLDPVDIANWPEAGDIPQFPFLSAYVTDEEIFSDVLLGRKAASQQDSWGVYWDGDPGITSGRDHPAGLLVEQRTLAWNYPSGNEGTIYFVYHVTNVSNNAYFQQINEARYFGGQNALPDEGWPLDEVYLAYAADPDVSAAAGQNFAMPILPFNMGIVWKSTFEAAEMVYPPAIFHQPFIQDAPGIIGTKYLKSPLNLGLTLFSVYLNGGIVDDPSGPQQLWRYLSGNLNEDAGDPECVIPNPIERRVCFVNSAQADVRFFQASGPFSIPPGETVTIVSAMFAAATVDVPGISQGGQNAPVVSEEPALAPSVHPGCYQDPITPLLAASGWVATEECPAEGEPVDIYNVEVVDESLLFKAQVAQTIFDSKFLLPFAPEPPNFYVVPGDRQATVVWEPSQTEEAGDPFFEVGGDEESPLYDPNFRQFDVEGYRIYRSNDGVLFNLVAQFDKKGTVFVDFTCQTDPTYVTGEECDEAHEEPLVGRLIQYPPGGVVELANGNRIVMEADSAPPSRFPELQDTGVPFVYVDESVRNGFEYYYRVTAFDINSLASGPTSLESAALPAKSVVPQPTASGVALDSIGTQAGPLVNGEFVEPTDNQVLDAATGRFNGPPPPTDALSVLVNVISPAQVAPIDMTLMTIDSIEPGYYNGVYYVTDHVANEEREFHVPGGNAGAFEQSFTYMFGDEQARDSLIALGVDAPPGGVAVTVNFYYAHPQWQSADADWAAEVCGFWVLCPPEESAAGGSRWFDGSNESMANPTLGLQHGQLSGVETIFQPVPYVGGLSGGDATCTTDPDHMRRFYQTTWAVRRVADMEVRWSSGGAPEVFDVTHQLPVGFDERVRASWGFYQDANGDGVLTHADTWFTPGLEATPNIGGCASGSPTPLTETPNLMPVDVTGDQVADGQGFAMYIAGEPYFFRADAVPASGTWTLRTHSGAVTLANDRYAHVQPSENPALMRTPGVPGLSVGVRIDETETFFAENVDLRDIRVAPDPYYGASLFELGPSARVIRFLNLPPRATVRIYSVSGVLVDLINHNSPTGGSLASWDLRNRSGQMIASGVYFYHVTTPEGQEHTGRFTVINSGLAR